MDQRWTILIFLGTFFAHFSFSFKKREVVLMKDFACCQGVKPPNCFYNTSTDYIGRGITVLNGEVLIKEPAKEVTGAFILMRCSSMSRADCEQIFKFPLKDLCERYEATDQYWSTLMTQIKPKYGCPFKKNTHYRLQNGTFDSSILVPLLNKFSFTSNSYWLLRNMVFRKSDNLELNCVDFLVKVEKIKVRA